MRLRALLVLSLVACVAPDASPSSQEHAFDFDRAAVAIVRNEHTGITDEEDLTYVVQHLGQRLPARHYYVEADGDMPDGETRWHFDGHGSWVLSYAPSGSRVNRAMFQIALQNAADFRPPPILQPVTFPDGGL